MELIIKEQRRPRSWYYCDGMYICKSGDKVLNRIKGEFLPNPAEIQLRRKEAQSMLLKSKRGLYRTQPDPITVALWNDWQARKSLG